MAFQNSFGRMPIGYAGMRVGFDIHDADTYTNDTGMKRKVVDVTITAADSTAYTLSVGGQTLTYTSGVGATVASIRDGLISAARANTAFDNVALFNMNGALMRISGANVGVDLAVSESDTNLALTVVQAFVAQTTIPFGRFVVKRPTAGGGIDRSCALPTATGQVLVGVAEREQQLVDTQLSNLAGYGEGIRPGGLVTAVKRGGMYVECVVDMLADAPVFVVMSGADAGKISSSGDALGTRARVKRGAVAGGIVELSLNLT